MIVLGESYSKIPDIFELAKSELAEHIEYYGYADSKADYYRMLAWSDIVVSTADHEFFGVSMLEASFLGCYPLVPNRLVYPELYPVECLYNTHNQLYNRIKKIALNPSLVRNSEIFIDYQRFDMKGFHRILFD